jgi:hypothetical protein
VTTNKSVEGANFEIQLSVNQTLRGEFNEKKVHRNIKVNFPLSDYSSLLRFVYIEASC